MRARWEALRQGLARSVRTLDAERWFEEARREKAALVRFTAPAMLVAFLTSKEGDLDEKDAVYAALVDLVQAGGDDADLAMSIIYLGLWPALDAIFRRRLRYFGDAADELASEIGIRLASLVGRADLSCITRVAATLTRSTERDVVDSRRRARDREARQVPLPADDRPGAPEAPCLPTGADIARLRSMLVPIVGDDTDLVIGAAVYGESHGAVARRLGLSHAAVRQRFHRAIARLRERFRSDR